MQTVGASAETPGAYHAFRLKRNPTLTTFAPTRRGSTVGPRGPHGSTPSTTPSPADVASTAALRHERRQQRTDHLGRGGRKTSQSVVSYHAQPNSKELSMNPSGGPTSLPQSPGSPLRKEGWEAPQRQPPSPQPLVSRRPPMESVGSLLHYNPNPSATSASVSRIAYTSRALHDHLEGSGAVVRPPLPQAAGDSPMGRRHAEQTADDDVLSYRLGRGCRPGHTGYNIITGGLPPTAPADAVISQRRRQDMLRGSGCLW